MGFVVNKDDANHRLRRSIKTLQGRAFSARPSVILQHVLFDLEELEASGWWWQSRILEYWIHRFMGGEFGEAFTQPERSEGCDLLPREEEGSRS